MSNTAITDAVDRPVNLAFAERISVRFGATLLANVARSGLSFLTSVIIARSLGASQYGNLNFLLGSFAAFTFLLDMGSTPAFFTFISQRRRTPLFFALYIAWTVGIQFVLTMLVLRFLVPDSVLAAIWVNQPRRLVLLACAASFLMTQAWLTVTQMGEATRKTILVQAAGVLQGFVHLMLVVMLVRTGLLNIASILWLLIVEFSLFSILVGPRLLRGNIANDGASTPSWKEIVREFGVYCAPLIIYGWVNCLYAFGNRWLLQEFGGSVQQGFFSVGQQFSVIGLIAATSILNVFWKEIAEAREHGDGERVRVLYRRAWRGLYCFAGSVTCFLIPYSRDILSIALGQEFATGWLTLAIMLLLPIHQSIGQLLGAFFYATAETRRYTKIGLASMLVTMPATYVMLAPPTARIPGLGLGSIGLALTMVTVQMAVINIQSRWLARVHGWNHEYGFQFAVIVLFLALGVFSRWSALQLFRIVGHPAVSMVAIALMGGVIYWAGVAFVVIRIPYLEVDREFSARVMRGLGFLKPAS
ncbi:MAG TPA: lipopolysaccharide biosynthesis protein [Thermoanaerobaculia bacterium]|nr:lipopolysaccharide biosynthesis protein [Thermoanaerobaculia bacterium]